MSNDMTGVAFDYSWAMSMMYSNVLPYYDGTRITSYNVCYTKLLRSLILYENHIINNERTTRESEIITDEMNSILKERFLYAQNIVLDLNNSSTLKQLYRNNFV